MLGAACQLIVSAKNSILIHTSNRAIPILTWYACAPETRAAPCGLVTCQVMTSRPPTASAERPCPPGGQQAAHSAKRLQPVALDAGSLPVPAQPV
eukprot:2300348-Alexandrium_andersonii.AAC.1